jgi:hypothetical protein
VFSFFYLSFRRAIDRLKKKKAAPISFLRTIDTALGLLYLVVFTFSARRMLKQGTTHYRACRASADKKAYNEPQCYFHTVYLLFVFIV